MKTIRNLSSLFAAIGVLAFSSNAFANVDTWTGAASSAGDWVTPADWGGTAPVSGDSLVFTSVNASTSATLGDTLTSSSFAINGITFNSGSVAYTMGGNAFELTGAITNNATTLQTFNNAITLGATETIAGGTGGLTMNSAISGTGFGLNTTGFVTLTGANTFTGTIVNSGTLVFNGSGFSLNAAGSTVLLNNGSSLTYNSGSGSSVVNATAAGTAYVFGVNGNSTTSVTLNGNGFSNGSTTNAVSFLVNGNGNLSWGLTGLNLANTSMFLNYGGTVNWGTDGSGIRMTGSTTSSNFGFATINLGTSTGNIGNKTTGGTLTLGALAGGSSTAIGSTYALNEGQANTSTTFSGTLNNSVTKVGTGTLTLNPSTAFPTNVTNLSANGGTLLLDNSNLTTPTNLLVSTSTLGFTGGELYIKGKTGSNTTAQTLGAVTLNSGGATLVVDPNGGTSTTLTLGGLTTTSAGGTLNIQPSNVTIGSGTATITTTTDLTTTGTSAATSIYSPRLTYGSDWATGGTSGASTLASYNSYADLTSSIATTTDTTNDRLNNLGNTTMSGSLTTNTLKIVNTTGTAQLALGGNTLTLTAGGLLFAGTANYSIGSSVNDGTLKSNTATASDLILQDLGTGTLTINSVIANGTGISTVTKGGFGTVVLAGTNTYTGVTYLNGGTTSVSADANLGAVATGAAVNMNGGTLQATSSFTLDNSGANKRNVVLYGGGGTIDVTSSNNLIVDGVVSNVNTSNQGPLIKTDTGTLTLSGTNTYTGATIISGGTLSTAVLANGGTSSGIGASVNTAPALVFDSGTLLYTGGLQSTDRTFTITQNGGGIDNEGTAALTLASTYGEVSSGSGARTFTFTANTASGNNTFAGALGDPSSGTMAVAKNGAGTWVFSGANTYTGGTTINNGTLSVATQGVGANLPGNVTFNGGTLAFTSGVGLTSSSVFNFASGTGTMTLGGYSTSTTTNQFTGSGAFNLSGFQLWLENTNSYSGAAQVTGGVLELGPVNTLAASSITANSGGVVSEDNNQNTPVTLNGGTLDANDFVNGVPTLTQSGAVTLNNVSGNTISLNPWYSTTQAETFTISSAIGGAGAVAITSTASGAILNLSGTNTYSGNTTISSNATVNITGTGVLGSGSYAGAIANSGTLNYNSSASQTLSGAITGTGALNVGGTGTVTLSNASNTFSGGSTVNGGGTLLLNGSGTGGNVSVGVASAGTLGGTGTVTGVVSVGAHGTITPGLSQAATGTLSVGSLTFSSGGTGDFYVNTSNASSLIAVTTSGGLTLTGGVIDPFNAGTANPANILGTYDLINYSGSDVGSLTTVAAPAGFSYALTDTGSQIDLTITATVSPNIWNVAGNTGGDWNNVGGTVQNWTSGTATNGPNAAGTAVTLGIGTTNASTGGPVNISSSVTIGSLTFDNANSYTLSATTGQSLTLNNSGSNSVISLLTGSHTISAAVVVNNPGTTISVVSGQKLTLSGNVSGTGTVTVNGPGTTLLSGTNSYGPAAGTVGTIFNSGTLQVGGNSALSTGDVSITGNNLLQSVAAGLTLANNFIITGGTTTTFGTNGNVFTLTGNITDGGTGTGAMTVASAVPGGTLILTGTGNTNGGAITINANTTLQIGNGTTGSIGTGAISNSGAFVDDSSSTIAPGAISGGGTVTQNGSGTLTLAGTNGYTGATSATAGTISLTGSLTGTPSVTTSGTGIVSETSTGSISGTGTTFTQGSSGTSTLGGANTYTGATSATAGTINLTTGSLTGSNVSTSGTGNFSEQSAGVIAGTGVTFTQGSSGTSTLGGTNTFTGATSITAGSLVVAGTGLALQDSTVTYSAGSLSFSGTTTATFGALSGSSNLALTNAASGTVTLTTGGDNASTTFSGNLTSNGSLIKTGTGTMILSGANTYTGATSVNAGVLTLTNSLGTVATSTGAINVNSGTLNLNSATVYASSMSSNSTSANTALNITGTSAVTLSGNLGAGGGTGTNNAVLSITGGTVTANSASVGRGFASYGGGVTAGIIEGIYVNGGTLNIGTTLNLVGNSSATMRIDSGSVTVAGTTTLNDTFVARVSLLDVNGGTFTSNDTTGAGILLGGSSLNTGELLVRAGTLNTNKITMGGAASTSGNNLFLAYGGTSNIGTGGIVALGTGTTQAVFLGIPNTSTQLGTQTAAATAPILAASGTWSSPVGFVLSNSSVASGSVAPTIQTGTAPTGGTSYNISLSGAVTGTGGLNKTGAGTLALSNTGNTYAGVTTINAGTLQISGLKNIGGLSYNSVTFNGGTLQYTAGASGAGSQDITTNGSSAPTINAGGGTIDTNGNTIEYANTIGHSGTGGLTLNDSNGTPGSLILDAVNTYTGTTTIARGTLVLNLSGANVLGSSSGVNLTSASSVLDITGTGSAATLAFSPVAGSQTINDLTGVAGSLIDLGSFALTAGTANSTVFAGVIQDGTSGSGGSFVKQGAGTITLTGANTYTGGTTISAGALQVGNGGTTGNLGTGGVTDNGSLVYDRSNNLTSTNLISGTGSVTQAGTGATTFTLANAYKGGTTIKAGTLYVNNTSGSGTGTGNISVGSGDIANSGTLAGSGKIGNVTTTTTVSVSGGGTISSGPVQANSPVGTVTGTGLTFTNTTINVSGDAPAILSFALGTNTTGGTGIYTFDNPSLNSTYMTLTGGSTLNFAGVDAISLTDLTTGSLALRQNVPYLLVSGTAGDITGLVTQQGYGASATLSLDGNGFVLGVWAGGSNPLTDYTPIAINQYGADGVTPLTGSNAYYDTTLYLENGNLEVVPEPGTWALMLGGLAALVLIRRTRRNNI